MSHQAVRDFYKAVAESSDKQEQYKKLTSSWFGFSRSTKKIVQLARMLGFRFNEGELRYVRLTNTKQYVKESLGSVGEEKFLDVVDLAPTAQPRPPEHPATFYSVHHRDPG